MIPKPVLAAIRKRFVLEWHGVHGAAHWTRVRFIGLKLATRTGANPRVVERFAFLHDSCRRSDGKDPQHGVRAALFAEQLTRLLDLQDHEMSQLVDACIGHSDSETHQDPTIATCWDADRLDLPRLGITPDPRRLCTAQAASPAFYKWAALFSARNAA